MKKVLSFFAFMFLSLCLTSCGNGLKKYKNEVSKLEFMKYQEKFEDVDFSRDFTFDASSLVHVKYESIEDSRSTMEFKLEAKNEVKVDEDNKVITEKLNLKTSTSVKTDKIDNNMNDEKQGDTFYQEYEGVYYVFDRAKKIGNNAISYDVCKGVIIDNFDKVDLEFENDDAIYHYYVDGDVYTVEQIFENNQKAVCQIVINNDTVSLVMVGDIYAEEKENGVQFKGTAKLDIKLEYKFQKVSIEPEVVDDYMIV